MNRTRAPSLVRRRQRGSLAVVYVFMMLIAILLMGLWYDSTRYFAGTMEMQNVADASALAAARALDGTPDGLERAAADAKIVAEKNFKRFHTERIEWKDDYLRFSESPDTPDGAWKTISDARAKPRDVLFARVEMVDKVSFSYLGGGGEQSVGTARGRSVAGPTKIQLMPLALCALVATPRTERNNGPNAGELLEFGFRRGIGYNLLALNPNDSSPASYQVNPIDIPGTPDASDKQAHREPAVINPHVCSGTLQMASVPEKLFVRRRVEATLPFAAELNSRFGEYTDSACTPLAAPPDRKTALAEGWMQLDPKPRFPGAAPAPTPTQKTPLLTLADLPLPLKRTTTAADYGNLWAYARPVRYGATADGSPFTEADWSTLYPVTVGEPPSPRNQPDGTGNTNTPYARWPNLKPQAPMGEPFRRVLKIPLLNCACTCAENGAAPVIGIGKFLMTAPAQADPPQLYAEFGGVVENYRTLGTAVEIIR
jgi:hypothetical protein